MVTVAGQVNTVGQPIFLLPIKTNNKLCVMGATGGGTLTIPEAPGFSLTFGPGQVTFPGGSKDGCISVTVVHPEQGANDAGLRTAAALHRDHSAFRGRCSIRQHRSRCQTWMDSPQEL